MAEIMFSSDSVCQSACMQQHVVITGSYIC